MSGSNQYIPNDDDGDITQRLQPLPVRNAYLQGKWMIVIVALLAIQIGMSGYQIIHDAAEDRAEEAARERISNSISSYTKNLDELTNQMLDDYKGSVYNNSQVDTTSKQVVMGTEYNFNAIMLLIKQNSRLMELIAELK